MSLACIKYIYIKHNDDHWISLKVTCYLFLAWQKKKTYHAWPRPWSPEALVSVPELDDIVNMHQEHQAIPQLEEHC